MFGHDLRAIIVRRGLQYYLAKDILLAKHLITQLPSIDNLIVINTHE